LLVVVIFNEKQTNYCGFFVEMEVSKRGKIAFGAVTFSLVSARTTGISPKRFPEVM